MKAVIIGCVFLAASIAYLCYEIRRAPLIEEQGRAALDQAMRTVPAQGPSPSNEDVLDRMIEDAALMFSEPPQFVPGVPCDAEINVWMDRWTAEQEGR